MSSGSRTVSRRGWMRRVGAAGLGLSGARPVVAVARGVVGANERLVVGHVGIGGRGTALLRMTLGRKEFAVAAVCDVDRQHLDRAGKLVGSAVATYGDYRKLLDRKDLDAVVVATPDHWHCLITIDACRAGKDVYVEKPLSQNVVEGRAAVRAARKHKRVVQVGTQHRCEGPIREVAELVRSGRIGKVREVELWMWEHPFEKITPGSDPPPQLDWDMWLGPARKVPYHPKRCHFNFRWFRDYAGGYMTDWGVHMINVITFAMDTDLQGPVSVSGRETPFEDNLYEFPKVQTVRWAFKDPDWVMTWTEPGPPGAPDRHGMRFKGSNGELTCYFGKATTVVRDGKAVKEPKAGSRPGDIRLPDPRDNLSDWLQAVRTRGRPINEVEVGHRNATISHLGNIASQLGRELRWDPAQEKVSGSEAAAKMLLRPYRAPWRLA